MAPIRNILVADRNPHVRRHICRELQGAGYATRPVSTGKEVILWIAPGQGTDLLVIDPELPDCRPGHLLNHVAGLRPGMIVIVHAFGEPFAAAAAPSGTLRYIEKSGSSIARLVQVVHTLNEKQPAA